MTQQFTHRVRAELVQVLSADGYAEVHRAGCAHQNQRRVERVGPVQSGPELVHETETKYVDDFFVVAPCARKP